MSTLQFIPRGLRPLKGRQEQILSSRQVVMAVVSSKEDELKKNCRITFYYVIKKGSTEEFSGIPYVVSLFNCLLYSWYGMPFVSFNNILVISDDGLGAVLEAIYVCLYLVYAPTKYRGKILGVFFAEMILFGIIAVVSVTVLDGTGRKLFVGILAASLSVCMYAAPLSIMKLVIETRSVEYMPFFLSLFVFLCSLSWFVYGIVGRDAFVSIPNGLGTLLGATQLMLYGIFRNSSSMKSHPEDLVQNA